MNHDEEKMPKCELGDDLIWAALGKPMHAALGLAMGYD